MNRTMAQGMQKRSPKLSRFGLLLAAVVLSYIAAVIFFIIVY